MSTLRDFHMHTMYCDGTASAEDMILSAVSMGLDCVGIVTHSFTWFDTSYCISRGKVPLFQREMNELREKYRDVIRVYCGVEQDYWSEEDTSGFDYVIGSVHYLRTDRGYFPVDENADMLSAMIDDEFAGDAYAMCGKYYETVSDVYRKTGCDIIGHFDLVTKFKRSCQLFSEDDPRYTAAAYEAVKKLAPTGALFEINTGAMSRGYRDDPYPSGKILESISLLGGKTILSSDAHRPEDIAFGFAGLMDAATGKFEPVPGRR